MDSCLFFCHVCDELFPSAMLSEGICRRCWADHARFDLDAEPLLQRWAEQNANRARGPFLLPAPNEGAL
jgi:hypothetical protein